MFMLNRLIRSFFLTLVFIISFITVVMASNLQQARNNPEFLLKNWIDLPTAPEVTTSQPHRLSLRKAILLALRYNPNIQNAELDRIMQQYQLRLAQNEFELQYALAGAAVAERTRFSGIGSTPNNSVLATPELSLKTKLGTQLSLNLDNNVSNYNSFTPVINFSVVQPLLRGFGRAANEANLLNTIDNTWLSKLSLQQAISDQITQVIFAYRALILSGNNLSNQRLQLKEANMIYAMNAKKITAGQLEPTANVQQSYQVESLNLMVEQAENDFKLATQELLQAIGLSPKMHLSVPQDVAVNNISIPNLSQALAIALEHNAQVLAQKIQVRADERAYQAAKNQQLWQLDLGANVQSGKVADVNGNNHNGFLSIYNGQNITEAASINLTIPIRDINRRSQLINAKIKLEQDRINLRATERALETTITNIINNIHSLAKRYKLAQKQVALAEQSFALEKKKLAAGIASALDVNNTQNQLIQAQAGLIGAKIAYLNQLSALQRLLGTTLNVWKIKLRYGQS